MSERPTDARRGVVGLGADGEQGRLGGAELGLDGDLVARHHHVVRERRLVELERVGAFLVDRDVPLPGLARGGLLGGARLVGHGDRDIGKDAVLGAQRAGDAGLLRAGQAQRVDGGGCR